MVEPLYKTVSKILSKDVFNNAKVLQVGVSSFKEYRAMHGLGASVTAIDTVDKKKIPANIRFLKADFLKWRPYIQFDIAYLSANAQSMPAHSVFVKLVELSPKIIAVRTFYDKSVSANEWASAKQFCFSSPEQWSEYFKSIGYQVVLAQTYKTVLAEKGGTKKFFRYTDFICKK